MFYIIDLDTRTVESKSSSKDALDSYIMGNGLEFAVALVSNADELCLQLSLSEMVDLSRNLGVPYIKGDEAELSELCMKLLEDNVESIPEFTESLSKKLLKAAERKQLETSTVTKKSSVAEARGSFTERKSGGKRLSDDTVLITGECPKRNTLTFKIWQAVEENLGEASVSEIIFNSDMDEEQCRKQISRSVRKGVLIRA